MKIRKDLVKRGLKEKGLTRETAAELMDIPAATFARIVTTGACSAVNLGRIAKLLDIPVWELVA